MEESPKVSVIIPTYNRKEYLTEAIDSVLNQTYKDFEIIVVDDGSTDGTGEMLKGKYGDKVRYFFKENGGCASARNYGIRMSRGEYIALLDSDDKYLPDKLEDQVPLLDSRPDIGFVYSDSYAFDGHGLTLFPSVRPDADNSVAVALFIMTYMANSSLLVRKKCLDSIGGYNESLLYNEDTDLMLKLAINYKVCYSNKPTCVYRIHSGRKSGNKVRLLGAVFASSYSILKTYPFFRDRLGPKAPKRLGQIRLDLAMEYLMQRAFTQAIEELEASYRLYPAIRKKIYPWLISKRIVQNSISYKLIAYFEQIIMKAVQRRLYRYTGWIL